MDLNLKFDSKTFTVNFLKKFAFWWKKIHNFIFFALLFVAIFVGGIIWNNNVNGSGWSEAKKQEYLDSHNKSISFDEKDFNQVVKSIEARKNYSESKAPIKDVFQPYN